MLRVLSVAYRLAPVDADPVGGAEQVLAALDRGLVDAGHQSIVLACNGSQVAGELVAVDIGSGRFTEERRARVMEAFGRELERLLRDRAIDVVHFHGTDCAAYLSGLRLPERVPKLVTVHVPLAWYGPELPRDRRDVHYNCVSDWQRRTLEPVLPVRATIPNGVDLARWHPEPGADEEYALCLGRICYEKGYDRALAAAHRAGMRLVLAGQTFPYPDHERYFTESIAPLLDAERRFIGPVVGEVKRRWLARAACLIVPSRVAETSSLVTMEALASGTPVIVSDAGAPQTLIEPGVTGWVAREEHEFVRALEVLRSGTGQRSRRARCRAHAERHFDLRETVRRYLELYAHLAREAGHAAAGRAP